MNLNVDHNDDNNKLIFHFECQNKAKNNLFRCRIHLDYKPENVAKINHFYLNYKYNYFMFI